MLSTSTEAYDWGEKFALYRRLSSLKEYALVSQDRKRVELFTKQEDGGWLLTEYDNDDDKIILQSIDCDLLLHDVYDKVISQVIEG